MHIEVEPPVGWSRTRPVAGAVVLRAPAGELTVHVFRIFPQGSVDLATLLERDRPPLSRWEAAQSVELTTTVGWPMQLITATMVGPAGPVETRLAAVYQFLHYAGAAVAIAADPQVYETHRLTVIGIFRSARPNLRPEEPLCVNELWELCDP
jgi:hypothetical protein